MSYQPRDQTHDQTHGQARDQPRDQAPRWTALFADAELVELLSRLGVHATHYGEGLFFPGRPLPRGEKIEPQEAWQNFLESLHPRDRDRIARAARKIYTGESRSFEETFRIRNPDDTYRWVVSKGESRGTTEEGSPLLYVGTETDITAHKELEEALQQKNRELLVLREAAAVIGASLSIHDTVQRILEQTRKIIPCQTASIQILQDT
ncbi:PAS domain S-box-containing protein [Alkalispirochaeta americana]|uniref:histidine kinase n=1 Tax=Alkalispirochaeta americana TaxID=159291 RepID=A0A1N6N5D5_9SPIO|nr:PAS domain-containing protein [Alkalispirochaeta americana]SIP87294.1 PAS domain S-box-containing protein [Alkalispirochaeta americana]